MELKMREILSSVVELDNLIWQVEWVQKSWVKCGKMCGVSHAIKSMSMEIYVFTWKSLYSWMSKKCVKAFRYFNECMRRYAYNLLSPKSSLWICSCILSKMHAQNVARFLDGRASWCTWHRISLKTRQFDLRKVNLINFNCSGGLFFRFAVKKHNLSFMVFIIFHCAHLAWLSPTWQTYIRI